MARICEKNTCPTGIATHDPKFKANYKGDKEKLVRFLTALARDVQNELKEIGYHSLKEIQGQTQLLAINPKRRELAEEKGFNLAYFTKLNTPIFEHQKAKAISSNALNLKIIEAINNKENLEFEIKNTDRAIPASLSGLTTSLSAKERLGIDLIFPNPLKITNNLKLTFHGSAGQGFGIFLPSPIELTLYGEANDSVAKGLCGGKITILPHKKSSYNPCSNTLIGNCALYGATSGELFVYGKGGDRFAVRNSGAQAVIEGVGIHALEYMTGGKVIILGESLGNIGAGMTGGILYLAASEKRRVNFDYLVHVPLLDEDILYVKERLRTYIDLTQSAVATKKLAEIKQGEQPLLKFIPKNLCT